MELPSFTTRYDKRDGRQAMFVHPVTGQRVKLQLWKKSEKVPPTKQGAREANRRAPEAIRRYLGQVEIKEAIEEDKVVTIGDFLARANQDPGKKGKVSDSTRYERKRILLAFGGWLTKRGLHSKIPITKITTRVINQYLDHLKDNGKTEKTQQRHFAIIRRAFNYLITNDELHQMVRNPAVRMFAGESMAERSRRVRDKSMPDEVLEELLSRVDETYEVDNRGTLETRAIAPFYMKTALIVMSKTGMRPGELQQAEWKDVDWKQKLLRIRKGKTGARTIVLSDDLAEYLKSRWDEVKAYKHTHIICLPEGGQLKQGTLTQAFARYREKLEISGENTVLKGLRHRYGHKLADALPVNRVAAAMGHTQITTTMVYIRAEVEDIADEVRGVDL